MAKTAYYVISKQTGRIGRITDDRRSRMDWETSRSVLWSDGTKGEIEDNDRLSISEGLYEQWAQIDAALVTHGVPDEILHNTRMLFVQVARYEGLKRRVRDFYDLDN